MNEQANTTNDEQRTWSLLSSYGLVLLYLVRHPDSTLRQIAMAMGLTERHVARIVRELENTNMIESEAVGRRKLYHLVPDASMRHPSISHLTLAEFVDALGGEYTEGGNGESDRPRGIRRRRKTARIPWPKTPSETA